MCCLINCLVYKFRMEDWRNKDISEMIVVIIMPSPWAIKCFLVELQFWFSYFSLLVLYSVIFLAGLDILKNGNTLINKKCFVLFFKPLLFYLTDCILAGLLKIWFEATCKVFTPSSKHQRIRTLRAYSLLLHMSSMALGNMEGDL